MSFFKLLLFAVCYVIEIHKFIILLRFIQSIEIHCNNINEFYINLKYMFIIVSCQTRLS